MLRDTREMVIVSVRKELSDVVWLHEKRNAVFEGFV